MSNRKDTIPAEYFNAIPAKGSGAGTGQADTPVDLTAPANQPGEAANPHGFPPVRQLEQGLFLPDLPSQIHRQPIYELAVGHDIPPSQLPAQLGPGDTRAGYPDTPPYEDKRLLTRKVHHVVRTPRYNHIYGSLRSEQAWDDMVDCWAHGTFTPQAGVTVTTKVSIDSAITPDVRLSRWPGAVQAYLCLRYFALAPQAATTATIGAMDIQFSDIAGYSIPIGCYLNNQSGSFSRNAILPDPITDPGNNQIGYLNILLNAGATANTCFWQLAFSFVYLLAQEHGYDYVAQEPFIEEEIHAIPVTHSSDNT